MRASFANLLSSFPLARKSANTFSRIVSGLLIILLQILLTKSRIWLTTNPTYKELHTTWPVLRDSNP